MGNNLYINLLLLGFQHIVPIFEKLLYASKIKSSDFLLFKGSMPLFQMEFDGKTIYIFRSSSLYYRRFHSNFTSFRKARNLSGSTEFVDVSVTVQKLS